MKRFEFSLDRVLKLKKQREWLAEQRQRQARAVLDAALAEVAALREQLAHIARALEAPPSSTADLVSQVSLCQQSVLVGKLVEQAEVKAEEAAEKLRQAEAERRRIATEVEVLLVLRRQKWAEYRQEAQRIQQDQLDEVGMRRWRIAQAESQGEG